MKKTKTLSIHFRPKQLLSASIMLPLLTSILSGQTHPTLTRHFRRRSSYIDQGLFHDQHEYNSTENTHEIDAEASAMLTDGMAPFDVLSSVFGSTLAPSELEDALANNGYDFERSMAWLVDRALPPAPPAHR